MILKRLRCVESGHSGRSGRLVSFGTHVVMRPMAATSRMRRNLFGLLVMCVTSACGVANTESETSPFARAFEVSLEPEQTEEFVLQIEQVAQYEGLQVRRRSGGLGSESTTLSRRLDDGRHWPEITIIPHDDQGPWVIFRAPVAKAYEPETTSTRELILSAIKSEWPNLNEIPIPPRGGVPSAEDLIMTDGGYRIARNKASGYGLPSNSPLVSD